jgi:hypothetical protein
VSACPTTNLAGCCRFAAGSLTPEECYYDPSIASSLIMACTNQNGTWTTSP